MYKTIFFLSIIFINSAFAQENWHLGPIELGNQHTLALRHSSITPLSPKVEPTGTFKIDLISALSNTFNYEKKHYLIDAEDRVLDLNLAYSITDNLELSLKNQLRWRGGGISDQPIEEWHKLFNLPKGKRHRVDHDSFSITAINDDGESFEITDQGLAIGDAELGIKYLLSKGGGLSPAVSLISSLRLPTGKDAFSQESIDTQIGILLSKSFGNFYLYSGLNYLYFVDSEINNLHYEQKQYGGFLELEYALNEKFSLNLGLIAASSLLDSVNLFPNYQLYLDTGLKYCLNKNLILQALIRENPSPGDGTTDITGALGLSIFFR